jgi:hypothetical protein
MAGDTHQIEAGRSATNVTVATATIKPSRAVYIGVAGDYDFNIDGSWIEFKATVAGSILPIQATGARDASDDSAPAATEIVFLH